MDHHQALEELALYKQGTTHHQARSHVYGHGHSNRRAGFQIWKVLGLNLYFDGTRAYTAVARSFGGSYAPEFSNYDQARTQGGSRGFGRTPLFLAT